MSRRNAVTDEGKLLYAQFYMNNHLLEEKSAPGEMYSPGALCWRTLCGHFWMIPRLKIQNPKSQLRDFIAVHPAVEHDGQRDGRGLGDQKAEPHGV